LGCAARPAQDLVLSVKWPSDTMFRLRSQNKRGTNDSLTDKLAGLVVRGMDST
jgi:hypothetical protein